MGGKERRIGLWTRPSYSGTKSTITTRRGTSGPAAHCAGALSVTLPEGGEKRPDPAPARPQPDEIFALCDIVTPNETELNILPGMPTDTVEQADAIGEDAIRHLGDRVSVLHMKDYRVADGKKEDIACGTGSMRYERLLRFAGERKLPMTLENTTPENAEQARLLLERISETL